MTRPSARRGVATVLTLAALWSNCLVCALNPVSVYFDDQFRGYDGFWSTAQIGVGTTAQYLSLLPNTVSSETWVAGPGGCDGTLTCQQARGGIFYNDRSSTWQELGLFEMGYLLSPAPLPAQYGLDTLTVSGSVSASNQSVAIFNTTQLWLGNLGLNVKRSQYGNDITRLPFISSLVHNESDIPSNSYGYTAGAYYSERSISGSLTLGGTDVTRYTPNDVTFKLNSDNYEPAVAIKAISVTSSTQPVAIPASWDANPLALMSEQDAAIFIIDSSTPFLWLPPTICDNFASALNLTYDSSIDLYIYSNATSPQNLTSLGLVFTFTLAETTTSSTTVNIPISYNAFNLQLTYPFPGLDANASSPSVNYFPLRRANSSLQYIIGRSFLQEAYLAVDYERGNFSLSAAIFPDLSAVPPKLVPITRPANSVFLAPQSSGSSLTTGAKAGIGVGVAVAVVVAIGIVALVCMRKRRSQTTDDKTKVKKRSFNLLNFVKQRKDSSNAVTELPADKRHPKEMQADATNTRFELPGNNPIEMPAGDIPDSYLQKSKDLAEPSSPENEARPSSIDKGAIAATTDVSERSQSPVPPYSPSDVAGQNDTGSGIGNGTNSSSAISPTSQHYGSGFAGTNSSGEQGISPIIQSSSMSNSFPSTENSASLSPVVRSLPGSQHQPSSSLNSQARNSMHSARISLQQDGSPMRTVSRSSRFREELIDEDPPERIGSASPQAIRKRFSWEQ